MLQKHAFNIEKVGEKFTFQRKEETLTFFQRSQLILSGIVASVFNPENEFTVLSRADMFLLVRHPVEEITFLVSW